MPIIPNKSGSVGRLMSKEVLGTSTDNSIEKGTQKTRSNIVCRNEKKVSSTNAIINGIACIKKES
jgi:hypothetical protein